MALRPRVPVLAREREFILEARRQHPNNWDDVITYIRDRIGPDPQLEPVYRRERPRLIRRIRDVLEREMQR